MNELDKLLVSLASVIIAYHDHYIRTPLITPDADPIVTRKKTNELAEKYLTNVDNELSAIIETCKVTDKAKDRYLFLNHIKDTIVYLQTQRQQTSSFNQKELKAYHQNVSRIFTDLIALLNEGKDQQISVHVPGTKTKISLSGLLNKGLGVMTAKLCESGAVLNDYLITPFNLTLTATPEAIEKVTASICNEHQNALLLPELKKQVTTQQQAIDSLKATTSSSIEILQQQIKDQQEIIATLQQQMPSVEAIAQQVAEYKSVNESLQRQIQFTDRLQRQVTNQQQTIASLQQQNTAQAQTNKDLHKLVATLQPSEAHKKEMDTLKANFDALRREVIAIKSSSDQHQSRDEPRTDSRPEAAAKSSSQRAPYPAGGFGLTSSMQSMFRGLQPMQGQDQRPDKPYNPYGSYGSNG